MVLLKREALYILNSIFFNLMKYKVFVYRYEGFVLNLYISTFNTFIYNLYTTASLFYEIKEMLGVLNVGYVNRVFCC
jgi:hypothetical protein